MQLKINYNPAQLVAHLQFAPADTKTKNCKRATKHNVR